MRLAKPLLTPHPTLLHPEEQVCVSGGGSLLGISPLDSEVCRSIFPTPSSLTLPRYFKTPQ